MSDLFSRMDPGQFIGLVAVGGGLLVAIVAILTGCVTSMRNTAAANELKQNMLDRGMSAEDIQTVLSAGAGSVRSGCGKRSNRV